MSSIQQIVPVAGGTDTALWRVEHGHATSALRVFRPGQAAVYRRELAAMQVAAEHGLPVPHIRAQGLWQERPVMLLSWCSGLPLALALRRQPWRLLKLSRAFGRMQARIHAIEVPALPETAPADWITWHQAVDSDLAARLRELDGHTPKLLHLDYHPLNVMVDRGGVSGVLDWANARVGDPRADVARTYTILAVEPHGAGREPLWYRAIRRLLTHNWQAGYQALAGELRDMPPFFAWAGAVMQADLARRLEDPHSWWQPRHMQIVERWTNQWRRHVERPHAG